MIVFSVTLESWGGKLLLSISLQVLQNASDTLTAVVIEGGAHHLDLRYTMSHA